MMIECHFCSKELPEEWASHVIYAKGMLHRSDENMPDYAVCGACLKYHGLKMSKLVSRDTIKRSSEMRK